MVLDFQRAVPEVGVAFAVAERRGVTLFPQGVLGCRHLFLVIQGRIRAAQPRSDPHKAVIVAVLKDRIKRFAGLLLMMLQEGAMRGRRGRSRCRLAAGRVLMMTVAQLQTRLLQQRRGPRAMTLAGGAALQAREARRVPQARGRVAWLTHAQHVATFYFQSLISRGRESGCVYINIRVYVYVRDEGRADTKRGVEGQVAGQLARSES